MTLKSMLSELAEARDDLKAAARLADVTDTRAARRRAQQRLRALADALSQKDFAFEAPEEGPKGGKN